MVLSTTTVIRLVLLCFVISSFEKSRALVKGPKKKSTNSPDLRNTSHIFLRVEINHVFLASILSQRGPDRKWHHSIVSVTENGNKLGLRRQQELLLVQHNHSSEGFPCVGRRPEKVLKALRDIEDWFNIVVMQAGEIKSIIGTIQEHGEWDDLHSGPGNAGLPGQLPAEPVEHKPSIASTIQSTTTGSNLLWRRNETVYIRPLVSPFYLKNECGHVTFAALRNQASFWFEKMVYINLRGLLLGRLEIHAIFKSYEEPMFLHTNGTELSLIQALREMTIPAGCFRHIKFIQHLVFPHAQLWYYESSSHRGRYLYFDYTTQSLKLSEIRDASTMFFTQHASVN